METLKKVVTNQYFPAGAVLTAVLLFWIVGLLGGLSLLNNNQPPLTTLTWMLFVYASAVLTPLAGLFAAADLIRRWRRNRAAATVPVAYAAGSTEPAADHLDDALPSDPVTSGAPEPVEPAQPKASAPAPTKRRPGRKEAA
ncbi:hypothetical protein LFT44_05240 [Arthrobacter sp. FW306-05-C]|uniref:hypothetical protein n=1 Tax=Arthrobacter TaxID=1663 RepID=UPI001EF0877F|nr:MULTISPECIES: hypothetical protein [Arthrobacter]MDP9986705.1 hypothetical protein [Arthrobacter oryzae]UKA67824.1 hypothetical protein LFT44_05240 [Arthrobacter sp. FW306-05-C]UKA72352.1 hypothetical protein LFT49_06345 [Arthrobacter sp. FW306-06-A]UKA76580.1 hypothetical protein LFT46_05870 [Arthrobacter sp. FW306-07-I]